MSQFIVNYLKVHAIVFCVFFDIAIIAGPFINPEPQEPKPVGINTVIPLGHKGM
jgi:hypothetical protein